MPDSETTPALPILIVEDDAGLATLVAETLHAEGLRTVIFSAGRDALAWLEGNEAALLILDYTLTDMNGTQFLARAGAQVTARTPFIVVTGLGDERIAVDMMKRGARDYLVKGLSLLDVLPVTVRNVLSQVETERHLALARQSLENVEHRYQRLFEDATEGIAVADFETGELLECNNAFLDLTGYALDELVGRSQKMLHPPEEGDSPVSRDFALHQSEKQGQTLASRMVTKSGALKDVEIKANAVDIGGRRVMIAFFRDVTAQLRIQRERAVMLDLLKLMNEKTDTRELVRCVTATVCEYTGCEAAGIRLRKGNDYPYFETRGFPPEFVEAESTLCVVDINGQIARDELGHPLHECMCGNVLHGRFDPSLPFFTPKGSFWTNSTSELLATTTVKERQARTRNRCNDDGYESVALIPLCTGGGMIGLLQLNDRAKGRFTRQLIEFLEGVADQVAIALAQRTAEAALRESVKRFEDISNAAGEFIWETGLDQRITYISSRVFDILGYRPDEMLGRRSTEFTAADTAASITAAIAGHLRSGSKFMDYEHSALHKSGSTVWLSVTAIPIQDERGEVAGWRGVSVDITRRKQAETERLEMERRLLHAQKLESLGVLAGGIAHDFNNLL
ncbi:PAS domain S-box protein, partial [bacterium]|nr:PAS domain S-box protein [bacterium]